MDLSNIINIKENVLFGIRGRAGHFKIVCNKLYRSFTADYNFEEVPPAVVLGIIYNEVPDGIIHLPPPLTDEQSDILKAYLTIGYLWMTKDNFGGVALWEKEPSREYGHWSSVGNVTRPLKSRECTISGLVSSSDLLPYDIGKALGVDHENS